MKRDAWDSDRFEDAVTRTVIALYETALSPDDVGPHWNQVAPAAIGVLRQRREPGRRRRLSAAILAGWQTKGQECRKR